MKFLKKSPDGGKTSGVTGYFLVEVKPLFSIVLLHFAQGSREAYHEHAFSAVTWWLLGEVLEWHRGVESPKVFLGGQWKFTPRSTFHKIEAGPRGAWALSFRGPWRPTWREDRNGDLVTLTHGRKVVDGE